MLTSSRTKTLHQLNRFEDTVTSEATGDGLTTVLVLWSLLVLVLLLGRLLKLIMLMTRLLLLLYLDAKDYCLYRDTAAVRTCKE